MRLSLPSVCAMRERRARSRFPAELPPEGKVWYTSTEGSHLALSAAQRERVLQNLVAEGLPRPSQYDDTPEMLAELAAAAAAAATEAKAGGGVTQLRLGYAAAGFSTALINNVFILYHLKLYTSVYKVSDAWLYAVFVFYGVWNTLNDPLFGWVEDRAANGSLLNSLQRRLFALRAGGLLLAVTFFALFTPWWSTEPGAPPPPPWLVGMHMMVCMSCYDAGLTWVCQAHNALLAELTVDNTERAALGRYSSAAMMVGSASALSAFFAWNHLSYRSYQLVCGALALLAAAVFELSYRLLSAGSSDAPAPPEPAAEGKAEGKGVWAETLAFFYFAAEAARSRSLSLFLVFGLCQQLNCTFNTSFFPLMVELLLVGQELPGWVSTVALLSSFVLPHFFTIFCAQLAGRLKECYPIIKTLNGLKILNGAAMLAGTMLLPLPPSQCGWLILAGMIVNRNVTECGCRLSSLVLADIIDEDRVVNLREKPMSSSIAGMHAIASKPGQSLAPMIGWYVLRSAGYTVGNDKPSTDMGQVALEQPPAVFDALLRLLIFLPGVVGVVQVVLWQLYGLHGPALQQMKAQVEQLDADAKDRGKVESSV